MENHLLSSPMSDTAAPTSHVKPASDAAAEALAEVGEAIVADCRVQPQKYLDEVRVAASGE